MKRPSLLALVAIGSLIGLSACSGPTDGQALPDNGPTTSTTTTETTSTSSSNGPLAGVDPCSLLTPSQLRQLGTPHLTDQGETGSARTCTYQSPLDVSPSLGAHIAIREQQGLEDFVENSGPPATSTIAGREVKIQCDSGNCLIGIAVTETSRVDIQGTVVGDDTAAKQLSEQIAEMVISNLPQG